MPLLYPTVTSCSKSSRYHGQQNPKDPAVQNLADVADILYWVGMLCLRLGIFFFVTSGWSLLLTVALGLVFCLAVEIWFGIFCFLLTVESFFTYGSPSGNWIWFNSE